MSVEEKRGCGFRLVGATYLVGAPGREVCDRLPYPVGFCHACGSGIKPSRAIRWMDGEALFDGNCKALELEQEGVPALAPCHERNCPVCFSDKLERVGLMWIGEQFYPTMETFEREAETLGVCKRISSVPKELILGKTWIFLVHPRGVLEELPDEEVKGLGKVQRQIWKPAIFHAFKPTAIEKIVTNETAEQELEKLKLRGITAVEVPADDPDHNPKLKKTGPNLPLE